MATSSTIQRLPAVAGNNQPHTVRARPPRDLSHLRDEILCFSDPALGFPTFDQRQAAFQFKALIDHLVVNFDPLHPAISAVLPYYGHVFLQLLGWMVFINKLDGVHLRQTSTSTTGHDATNQLSSTHLDLETRQITIMINSGSSLWNSCGDPLRRWDLWISGLLTGAVHAAMYQEFPDPIHAWHGDQTVWHKIAKAVEDRASDLFGRPMDLGRARNLLQDHRFYNSIDLPQAELELCFGTRFTFHPYHWGTPSVLYDNEQSQYMARINEHGNKSVARKKTALAEYKRCEAKADEVFCKTGDESLAMQKLLIALAEVMLRTHSLSF